MRTPRLRRQPLQLDERGVADEVEQAARDDEARHAAGHRREEDHGRAVRDRRVEPVERAHVLALDVDVHERRDLVVLDELRAQAGEARHQVVEQLAHGVAGGGHLALAARLGAKRRWNADGRHAVRRPP